MPVVRLIVLSQIFVTALSMVAFAWLSGQVAAWSAALAGVVGIIPNVYFARRLFLHRGARAARQIVNNMYKGEALKMVLTIALFSLVFALATINPIAFFFAYIAVQAPFWMALLVD